MIEARAATAKPVELTTHPIQVQTAEGIGEREVWQLNGIFRDLHLTPGQQRLIPEVVPAWLSKPMPTGTAASAAPSRGWPHHVCRASGEPHVAL